MAIEDQITLTAPTSRNKFSSVHPVAAVAGGASSERKRNSNFIDRLEAVRGVAAMMVAMGHSLVILPSFGWQEPIVFILLLIMNGRAAVTLFFVLSGLVLGLSLRRGKEVFQNELVVFSIRRVLRIYPAFLFCVVTIAMYLFFCFSDFSFPSAYICFESFYGDYHAPVTPERLTSNFVFTSNSLNPVTWTLRIEMICSLLLPFLHWLSVKMSNTQRLLLLGGLITVGFFPKTNNNINFLFMFFSGYLLPMIGPNALGYLRANRRRAIWVVAGALPLLFCSRLIIGRHVVLQGGYLIETFGASVLIACLLYAKDFRIYRILDHPVVRFYGKISYSFYLWHFFCLFLVSRCVLDWISRNQLWHYSLLWAMILWFLSTIVATAIAYVSYRLIEKPFIQLSKEICCRISTRMTASHESPKRA